MKKVLGMLMLVLVATGVVVASNPTIQDDLHWHWVSQQNSAAGYARYLASWPQGRHVAEARLLRDEQGWSRAQTLTSADAMQDYLRDNTDGRHVAEARRQFAERLWLEAVNSNRSDAYRRYATECPEGPQAAEARDRFDARLWDEAVAADTVDAFERYRQLSPDGKHAAEVDQAMEKCQWNAARSAGTCRALQAYIAQCPDSPFIAEARTAHAALLADDGPFEQAQRAGSQEDWETFLADFPGHRREADARAALEDLAGRDIVELIRDGRVEVESQGSGIEAVSVRLRRLVASPVKVRIPVGTFFVSENTSSQNMVTTGYVEETLNSDDWVSVSPPAACADRPRDIPGTNDRFTVQASPHQAELARLMPVLDAAGVPYAVRQAAVWIVTDNADYDDLGILVSSTMYQPFGGTRVIHENEAARAMQICAESGIDITQKAIWSDRAQILQGLTDEGVKPWLSNVDTSTESHADPEPREMK